LLYLNKRQTRALYRVLKGCANANTMNKRQKRQFAGLKNIVKTNLHQQKTRQGQMSIREINRIWDY
jgi:hypothetical protein